MIALLPPYATHDRRTAITQLQDLPGDLVEPVENAWLHVHKILAMDVLQSGAHNVQILVFPYGALVFDRHSFFALDQGAFRAILATDDPRLHKATAPGNPQMVIRTDPHASAHSKLATLQKATQSLQGLFPCLHLRHPEGNTTVPLTFTLDFSS